MQELLEAVTIIVGSLVVAQRIVAICRKYRLSHNQTIEFAQAHAKTGKHV